MATVKHLLEATAEGLCRSVLWPLGTAARIGRAIHDHIYIGPLYFDTTRRLAFQRTVGGDAIEAWFQPRPGRAEGGGLMVVVTLPSLGRHRASV